MSKPELIVLIGLPASGKSTEAAAWLQEDPDARIVVNRDRFRLEMFGPDWVWNRKDEEKVKAHSRSIATRALMAGLSVAVDDTNLSQHVRASWQDLGRDLGAEYIEQDVSTPLDECIHRDRLRTGKARVGQGVIDRMAMEYGLLDWEPDCICAQADYKDGYHHRGCPLYHAKRPIAIVDIDGTVADCSKRLHHLKPVHKMDCTHNGPCLNKGARGLCPQCGHKQYKDWDAFFAEVADNDEPIAKMIQLLSRLEEDHLIVMVSGRPISSGRTPVGILTEDWLLEHVRRFDRLFLRQTGDHTPDFEYKKAVLDHIPKDRIAYVFEDSVECVAMYRREGLYVLQTADAR